MLLLQNIKPVFASSEFLFVTITSETCYSCQKLKPVLEELKYEYGSKVRFVTLDVSTRALTEKSRHAAKNLGISNFFSKNLYITPTIGILCGSSRKIQKIFIGRMNKETYQKTLDKLLVNEYQLCSL